MKKGIMLLTTLGILAGCGTQGSATDETSSAAVQSSSAEVVSESAASVSEEAVSVTIQLSVDGEMVEGGEKTIETENTNLLEVMKENYEVEEADGFITSINGNAQNEEESKYWMFKVNGEDSMVGAAEVELQEGDIILWTLEAM